MTLLENIEITFSQNDWNKSVEYGIAISGGVDSVVLAHSMYSLGYSIHLLHCNFQLRGKESDVDLEFVQNLAQQLNIPFHSIAFETEKEAKQNQESIQITARKLRYDWFQEVASQHNLEKVFLAHHLNDQVETFFINFLRGTGIKGLIGIPESREIYGRPLLNCSRNEIEKYAKENNLNWREDKSNESDKYLRNNLRHHILPVLEEIEPSYLKIVKQNFRNLKQASSFVEQQLKAIFEKYAKEENGVTRIKKTILQEENAEFILNRTLSNYEFSSNQIEEIYSNLQQVGKLFLAPHHELICDREVWLLRKIKKENLLSYTIYKEDQELLSENVYLKWSKISSDQIKFTGNTNEIYLNDDLLKWPLEVRLWQKGDRFTPFGMRGSKKISDFLIDLKLDKIAKEKQYVLTSNGQIVWIIGKRMSDIFKITPNNENVIKFETKPR